MLNELDKAMDDQLTQLSAEDLEELEMLFQSGLVLWTESDNDAY